MKVTLRELRDMSRTSADVAIKNAMDSGITITHALLALHDGAKGWQARLLEYLVSMARGTMLSPMHQHGDGDTRRWYLRAIVQTELPFDRVRGYCPVRVSSHHPLRPDSYPIPPEKRIFDPQSDIEPIQLAWSDFQTLRAGVATHSALMEFVP